MVDTGSRPVVPFYNDVAFNKTGFDIALLYMGPVEDVSVRMDARGAFGQGFISIVEMTGRGSYCTPMADRGPPSAASVL